MILNVFSSLPQEASSELFLKKLKKIYTFFEMMSTAFSNTKKTFIDKRMMNRSLLLFLEKWIYFDHGIRRMVEARSGLPKKSPTLTMKKRVLECKFGITYF